MQSAIGDQGTTILDVRSWDEFRGERFWPSGGMEPGGRAAVGWFVLTYLLGREHVRVYDGSWAEWGRMTHAPVEQPVEQPTADVPPQRSGAV